MTSRANKTQPTTQDVGDFLAALSPEKQLDSQRLVEIMSEITGERAVMWGPSIIGFGSQHYKYVTGREGNMPTLAFSPRKSAITIYITEGFEAYGDLLDRLGKHTTSVSCLYIKKLADIDIAVLRELITRSFQHIPHTTGQDKTTVESYVANVPPQSAELFARLRMLARQAYPDAEEVISYGIVGYRVGKTRPIAFISGWKDHVAVYPIPHDAALQEELKPYIKGKGTLWFAIGSPLPETLASRVFAAHLAAYRERSKTAKGPKK